MQHLYHTPTDERVDHNQKWVGNRLDSYPLWAAEETIAPHPSLQIAHAILQTFLASKTFEKEHWFAFTPDRVNNRGDPNLPMKTATRAIFKVSYSVHFFDKLGNRCCFVRQ